MKKNIGDYPWCKKEENSKKLSELSNSLDSSKFSVDKILSTLFRSDSISKPIIVTLGVITVFAIIFDRSIEIKIDKEGKLEISVKSSIIQLK